MSNLTDLQTKAMAGIYKKGADLDKEVWHSGATRTPSYTLGFCYQAIIDAMSEAYQLGVADEHAAAEFNGDLQGIPSQDPDPYYDIMGIVPEADPRQIRVGDLGEVEEL